MLEIIKDLTTSDYLISRLRQVCDDVYPDGNGNIMAHIKGTSDNTPLMLATHTDRPHFLCMGTDDKKISLVYVGNSECSKWESCPIISKSGVMGIIDDSEDKLSATIDVNFESVRAGDVFYTDTSPIRVGNTIAMHGISATAPAAALLQAAEALAVSPPVRDVYFAFTEEGQYGFRLYSAAAKKCGASRVICIGAIDENVSENVSVRLCDRSFSSDKTMSDKLISCGASPIVLKAGKCAASTVQLWGIPSAQLDLPVKGLGTANEAVKEAHISTLTQIITTFCNK